jgi:hypothetical protein
MAQKVNVDNFSRAETDRMFSDLEQNAGAINTFKHNREPTPIDKQTVIRMNRDTLYSIAIADLSEGATLTIPDHGDRYLSLMIVDNDHYINQVFHDAGEYKLTASEAGSEFVALAARILVDPEDEKDIARVASIQDGLSLEAGSSKSFVSPEYDKVSLDTTRNALLELAPGLGGVARAFGSRDQVDPVRHLIGTAAGWGGLPDREASYVLGAPSPGVGNSRMTFKDVPVDAFWSISIYNAEGFFEENEMGSYTVNSVTAESGEDGAVTVHLGDFPEGTPNAIPTPEGWNYTIRLYRPHPEITSGDWTPPSLESVS